ncbi:hypothetical protein FGO68_gene5592 [Halteria grandinella]|uniref:Protein kinase domain-containing protein n=1 Tax=Halteria grandinella TaxID=5974 RepID=A0A8J8P3B1_HALGN|nr:hypothetical protein FGO68_gene5592 [Halteria grandinella]
MEPSQDTYTTESSSSEMYTHDYLEMDINEASHYEALRDYYGSSDSERIESSSILSPAQDYDTQKIVQYSFDQLLDVNVKKYLSKTNRKFLIKINVPFSSLHGINHPLFIHSKVMKHALEQKFNADRFLRYLVKEQAQLQILINERVPLGFKMIKLKQSLQKLFVDTAAPIKQSDQEGFNKKVSILSTTKISKLYIEGNFIYKQPLIKEGMTDEEKFTRLLNNIYESQIIRLLDFMQENSEKSLNKELLHFNTQGDLLDHFFVREKFYVLNEITDAKKFDFAILKILQYFSKLNSELNIHHGDIKPENIFLSHDEHDTFLFVTTDSGSLIKLDGDNRWGGKEKKYFATTFTPEYSTQKYKDSVKNGVPLTYVELIQEDLHQLQLTLQKQVTRFEPTKFTKMVLSHFSKVDSIWQLEEDVKVDASFSHTFAQLHLANSTMSSDQLILIWKFFGLCVPNNYGSIFSKFADENTLSLISLHRYYVDCNFDHIFHCEEEGDYDQIQSLDIDWNMSFEESKRLRKEKASTSRISNIRPEGIFLKRLVKSRNMYAAQEAFRQMAVLSGEQVHLKKILRSFPHFIEIELQQVLDIEEKENARNLMFKLYAYGIKLVKNEKDRATFQDQFEIYQISCLTRLSVASIEELRNPSYILDSNNFPSEYLAADFNTEEDFILKVRQGAGKTIVTTFKIARMCNKKSLEFFQDFLELIERYQIQHIVMDADSISDKEQLNLTSDQMVKNYLHFARMKNVHTQSIWVPERIGDLQFLKGPIWTIQSLTSPINAAQHVFNSQISLISELQKGLRNIEGIRHKEFLFLRGDQTVLNYIVYKPRAMEEQEEAELVLLYLLDQILIDIMVNQKAYIEPYGQIDKIDVIKDIKGRIIRVVPMGSYVIYDKQANYDVQGQIMSLAEITRLSQDYFCQFVLSLNMEHFCPTLIDHLQTFILNQSEDSQTISCLQTLLYHIRCDHQLCFELTQKYPKQSDPLWNNSSNLWYLFTGCISDDDFGQVFKHKPKQIQQPAAFQHFENQQLLGYFVDSFSHEFSGIQCKKTLQNFANEEKLYIQNQLGCWGRKKKREEYYSAIKGNIRFVAKLNANQKLLKRLIFEGIIETYFFSNFEPELQPQVIELIQYAIEQVEGGDRRLLEKQLEEMTYALLNAY